MDEGGRAYAIAGLHSVFATRTEHYRTGISRHLGGLHSMCIRVQRADTVTAPWSPTQDTLTIPARVPDAILLDVVRAALADLGILQPPRGAVCWCGEEVHLPPHIPIQRTVHEVMHNGA